MVVQLYTGVGFGLIRSDSAHVVVVVGLVSAGDVVVVVVSPAAVASSESQFGGSSLEQPAARSPHSPSPTTPALI